MSDWIPKLNGAVDLRTLPLTPEEGFVLSRLDGVTPVSHLPSLTGLPGERLEVILRRLVAEGALLPESRVSAPSREARAEDTPDEVAEAPASEPEPPEETESEESIAAAGNYRQLFELRLHPLPQDERAARAHTAEDPELSAFCFDPVPAVIKAVLENPRTGLEHARLIVRYHRNPVGLEALCARSAFAADAGVRRWLVRNPQLPAGLFRRLWGARRMLELHKLTMDRDVPELSRRNARELLRQRFANGPSEEKAELIFNTEGRSLAALSGLPVDGKTTALLCGRTYRSTMLIQNIARWSAAPPALIAHLLRQETVRRQPMLRTLLARHPNAPAEAKREV